MHIDIRNGEATFSLPDFGLSEKETLIDDVVWDKYKDELVKGKEVWGMIELGYRSPEDFDIEFEYESKRSRGKTSRMEEYG